ncbi:MAG: LacI family DNA-binding transcriptional regulator [Oscillospiraceae bacterium]
MAVTIKDIAAIANVSRGTVDRALNNRAGVNADVAKRILKIAADLGYRPNKAGKALAARKKSTVIGVMLPSIGNRFYDEVIAGIYRAQQEFADYGLKVILRQYKGYSTQRQLQMIEELEQENINALCLVPIDHRSIGRKSRAAGAPDPGVAISRSSGSTAVLCETIVEKRAYGGRASGLMTGGNVLLVTGSSICWGTTSASPAFARVPRRNSPTFGWRISWPAMMTMKPPTMRC